MDCLPGTSAGYTSAVCPLRRLHQPPPELLHIVGARDVSTASNSAVSPQAEPLGSIERKSRKNRTAVGLVRDYVAQAQCDGELCYRHHLGTLILRFLEPRPAAAEAGDRKESCVAGCGAEGVPPAVEMVAWNVRACHQRIIRSTRKLTLFCAGFSSFLDRRPAPAPALPFHDDARAHSLTQRLAIPRTLRVGQRFVHDARAGSDSFTIRQLSDLVSLVAVAERRRAAFCKCAYHCPSRGLHAGARIAPLQVPPCAPAPPALMSESRHFKRLLAPPPLRH